MSVTTQNIDIIPVLQDAEVDLNLIDKIEIAPLLEGGIEIIDHYSDSMLESDFQRHRLYLCQEGTGYFCDLMETSETGRVGRTGEVLTPGPEDVFVSPMPFFDEGIADDEVIVVICDYAEEQHTGQIDYGYQVTIYTPRTKQPEPDIDYDSMSEEELLTLIQAGKPGAQEAWVALLKEDLGEEAFEKYALENGLA